MSTEILKAHDEIIDEILNKNLCNKIAEENGVMYYPTNYAITCENKLVCYTGSDYIVANNIQNSLEKYFPNKEFLISEEFLAFGV